MCNVYRSVGSLTTIKSHLQRNNVTGLTSLNELIAFQKNYSTFQQQIITKHELSITQEKKWFKLRNFPVRPTHQGKEDSSWRRPSKRGWTTKKTIT